MLSEKIHNEANHTKDRTSFQRLVYEVVSEDYVTDDPIFECGSAVLSIIHERPNDVLQVAHEKLHAFPFKDVPESWRRLYTEASLWKVLKIHNGDWISEAVKLLDMAVILTGAPRRSAAINSLLRWLQDFLSINVLENTKGEDLESNIHGHTYLENRSYKRRKIEREMPESFPHSSLNTTKLISPLPRITCQSLPAFERRLNEDFMKRDGQELLPFIITDSLVHWPAVSDHERTWANPQHLLRRTLGGRRLVPVELGRSYTDDDWGQKIMTFGEFLEGHMLQDIARPERERKTGYLAQHDLFTQVPELRSDICIPDFCYANVPEPGLARQTSGYASTENDDDDEMDDVDRNVMLNAWFGPAHTISPMHTDPHHNILAQVVGSKYVRLYAPSQTEKLYPRTKEGEVDMSNTSQIDVDLAMKIFEGRHFEPASNNDAESGDLVADAEQVKNEFAARFPKYLEAEYVEGILTSGDCLFIPRGWWHYIRSLSPSCSVSFWWD